jgi:hypothetical protein
MIINDYDQSKCVGGKCTVTPTQTLTNGKSYGWFIAASDGTNLGPYSSGAGFIVSTLPAAPKTISPTGMFTSPTLSPSYSWTAVAGGVKYVLALYDMKTQSPIYVQTYDATAVCSGATCSTKPSVTLTNGGAYAWLVAAISYAGVGPWSAGTGFIIFAPPAAPTLSAPTGVIKTAAPSYTWQRVPGAVYYYVTVLDGSGKAIFGQWYEDSTSCSGTTCSASPNLPLAAGNYGWFGLSLNAAGMSSYSTGIAFVRVDDAGPGPAPSFQPSKP